MLTTLYADASVAAVPGVYAPQHDSLLLIEALRLIGPLAGRSVLDLCTGSGVVAIAAARRGAADVTAFDICERAIRCTRRNSASAGAGVRARIGSHTAAVEHGPYDVVLANPPYVPVQPGAHPLPAAVGPSRAWDAGPDGRLVLDPLCDAAPRLMNTGGVMLIVQSEFAAPEESLRILRRSMDAAVVLSRTIPFGPVMHARAEWMQSTGILTPGRRQEELVVIRADKT